MYAIPLPGYAGMLLMVTVILTFTAPLAVLSALAFFDSRLTREHLAGRLAATRMYGMLERRHVLPGLYLGKVPPAEIRAQIRTCQSCTRTADCDRALRYRGHGHTNYDFCPNHSVIDRLIAC